MKPITHRIECLDELRKARLLIAAAADDDAASITRLTCARAHLVDAIACLDAAVDAMNGVKS